MLLAAITKTKGTMLVLSVIGLLVALYLTIYHYSGVPLYCPNSGAVDCQLVLNSAYSMLLGIPIAAYGLAFFAIEIAIVLHFDKEQMLLWNTIGLGFVFYLAYAEYMLGSICLYCTTIHVIVVLLFLISAYLFAKREK
jgi:uncharacterized membrane protein